MPGKYYKEIIIKKYNKRLMKLKIDVQGTSNTVN